MADSKKTKSTAGKVAVAEAAATNIAEVDNKTTIAEPLVDSTEIAVVSLIPNVSYKDSHSGDLYEWDEVGHVEYLSFETLKNMWRTAKSYFRDMWLKPQDDRVIEKFGLKNTFAKYEFLMDATNYTRKNIETLCKNISDTSNGMRFAICNKIKNFVVAAQVTDVSVIKALEKHLDVDLISFLE